MTSYVQNHSYIFDILNHPPKKLIEEADASISNITWFALDQFKGGLNVRVPFVVDVNLLVTVVPTETSLTFRVLGEEVNKYIESIL